MVSVKTKRHNRGNCIAESTAKLFVIVLNVASTPYIEMTLNKQGKINFSHGGKFKIGLQH